MRMSIAASDAPIAREISLAHRTGGDGTRDLRPAPIVRRARAAVPRRRGGAPEFRRARREGARGAHVARPTPRAAHRARGGTLGEAPFFDHDPYPVSAIAWTPVAALYMDRGCIERAVRSRPEIALFFLSRSPGACACCSIGSTASRRRASALGCARICSSRRSARNGAIVVITQESLAEELGTVREVVMRALQSLRKQRIIAGGGRGQIEIINRSALRELATR